MKLINQSYKVLSGIDGNTILKNIERAGRTCYKSEQLITVDSANKFVGTLIKNGHESVLEHEKISILFVCDRGVSHELVRHRLASFSQESTRYCNYSNDKFGNELTFIEPIWAADNNDAYNIWFNSLLQCELDYNKLISLGWQAQHARTILPNSLKTEIVVTANLREWRTIFKQRTTRAAHPQMRELMCPLLDELKLLIPVIFNDITY
jgi:thymidylate synthase (FAD)